MPYRPWRPRHRTSVFWGVQYHPELHFSDIARCLERSDFMDIFEAPSAIGLNPPAGLSREEIIHDFHHLDEDKYRAALKKSVIILAKRFSKGRYMSVSFPTG